MEQLDELASRVAALLAERLTGGQQKLGFCQSPRPRYIYCNRSQSGLWYWLDDTRKVVNIPETALCGRLEKLEFKQVERRGKDTWKIHLHVMADRYYLLEAGYDSTFSKCLLSALSVMSPQQIQQPVTLEVQAAESDEVLFLRVYAGGELIFAPWDENTTWKVVAKRAMSNVEQAKNGIPKPEPEPEPEPEVKEDF